MGSTSAAVFANQLLTKEDLLEFKENLLAEIRQIVSHNPKPKKWIKSGEVRKLMDISPGTLQNLRSNGTLSFTKVGSIIYYDYTDIQKLLDNS